MNNKAMKSSPYVYPYTAFNNLSNKDVKRNIVGNKTASWSDIREVLNKIKIYNPKENNNNTEENILSIFLNNHYLFGPKKFILDDKEKWLTHIKYFTSRNKPILFTILGFPFKVPVTLKTNRTIPDMGDVLALYRLFTLNQLIKKRYRPGACTYIFTEGPFGSFTQVPKRRVKKYMTFLQEIVNKLEFQNSLKLIDLGELEKQPKFKELYKNKIKYFKKKYLNKDQDYLKKFNGAYSSIYRIVGTEQYSEKVLMDVYNDKLSDKKSTKVIREIRKNIAAKTEKAVILYHSYLAVRDELNFIDKTVPHSLPLSVSPKPGRLGILPIDKTNIRIPHHAVTTFIPRENKFYLEYLIDLKRSTKKYFAIYLKGDKENVPFYYSEI